VAKAIEEISYANKFDLIIVNDILEQAQAKAFNEVEKFIK
jgi:guanylate kinase